MGGSPGNRAQWGVSCLKYTIKMKSVLSYFVLIHFLILSHNNKVPSLIRREFELCDFPRKLLKLCSAKLSQNHWKRVPGLENQLLNPIRSLFEGNSPGRGPHTNLITSRESCRQWIPTLARHPPYCGGWSTWMNVNLWRDEITLLVFTNINYTTWITLSRRQ